MESKANYRWVGLLVIGLTLGLISSAIWLSIGFDKKSYDIYMVYMHEAVSGLSEDAPVKFNGVKVGNVKKIQLNEKNPQQVELMLSIAHGTPITTSTVATLISQGITGTTYVGLSASSSDLTPLKALKGERYPVIASKASLFNQLDNALKGVSANINSVTIEIRKLFNTENTKNLKETLEHLNHFSATLDATAPDVKKLLTNLSQASEKVPSISTHFNESFTTMAQETLPALNQILAKMDRIANNLEKTSREVRQNPDVILRGHTQPKPGPGE